MMSWVVLLVQESFLAPTDLGPRTDSRPSDRKYTWGLDVGGLSRAVGLECPGGIGGLLAVYDTNGNAGQMVAWADGYLIEPR